MENILPHLSKDKDNDNDKTSRDRSITKSDLAFVAGTVILLGQVFTSAPSIKGAAMLGASVMFVTASSYMSKFLKSSLKSSDKQVQIAKDYVDQNPSQANIKSLEKIDIYNQSTQNHVTDINNMHRISAMVGGGLILGTAFVGLQAENSQIFLQAVVPTLAAATAFAGAVFSGRTGARGIIKDNIDSIENLNVAMMGDKIKERREQRTIESSPELKISPPKASV